MDLRSEQMTTEEGFNSQPISSKVTEFEHRDLEEEKEIFSTDGTSDPLSPILHQNQQFVCVTENHSVRASAATLQKGSF